MNDSLRLGSEPLAPELRRYAPADFSAPQIPAEQLPQRVRAVSAGSDDPKDLVTCPKCSSTEIRRVNPKSRMGVILNWFSVRRYRCHICRNRFYGT